MKMKFFLFIFVLCLVIFLLRSGKVFSIESIGNIATFPSPVASAVNSSTPTVIPTIKPIGFVDNSPSQTQNTGQSPSIPTIPNIDDSKINISSIPPTIIPIDKKKEQPTGLLVTVPKELFFPERSVSTTQQWTQIDFNPKKPITIVDDHEGNVQWDLTISANNFADGSDIIFVDNLTLLADSLVAREGSTQNIHLNKTIQFLKPDESYLLVHKDVASDKGIYDIIFGLKLRIPPNTSAGHFRTVMVLTII